MIITVFRFQKTINIDYFHDMKKQFFLLLVTSLMAITSAFAQTRELQIFKGGILIQSFPLSNIDSIKVVDVADIPNPPAQAQAVDLGLSVKWANMNVGASKPEDYGDYFAWGETKPKTNYDWSTYKWCNGSYYMMTKYCTNSSYGTVDNKGILEPEDDAARANWGDKWRMPTYSEQIELSTRCTWRMTSLYGVNGYLVTGPSGNSIFLPAAGSRQGSSLMGTGEYGNFWRSDVNLSTPIWANGLLINDMEHSPYFGSSRCNGLSVRPVTE